MRSLRTAMLLLLVLATAPSGRAAEAAPAEAGQIEGLIRDLESLKDASFIRNGSSHDAKTAAKFLRGKWNSRKSEVATPAEFIEKVASASSTTGKPYVIKFKDGREVKCGDFLKERLEVLRKTSPKSP